MNIYICGFVYGIFQTVDLIKTKTFIHDLITIEIQQTKDSTESVAFPLLNMAINLNHRWHWASNSVLDRLPTWLTWVPWATNPKIARSTRNCGIWSASQEQPWHHGQAKVKFVFKSVDSEICGLEFVGISKFLPTKEKPSHEDMLIKQNVDTW